MDSSLNNINSTLQNLERSRILRLVEGKYEFSHDVLAREVAGKQNPREVLLQELEQVLRNRLLVYARNKEKYEERYEFDYLSRSQVVQVEDLRSELLKRFDSQQKVLLEEFLTRSQDHWRKIDLEKQIQRERELELEQSRLIAEKKAIQRKNSLLLTVGLAIILFASAGFWVSIQRGMEKEKYITTLRTGLFQQFLGQERTAKVNGKYKEALAQLDSARIYVKGLGKDKELSLDQLNGQINFLSALVPEIRDSLSLFSTLDYGHLLEKRLFPLYQKADGAYQQSRPDAYARNLRDQVRTEIIERYCYHFNSSERYKDKPDKKRLFEEDLDRIDRLLPGIAQQILQIDNVNCAQQ